MANRVKRALFVALSVVAAVIAFAGEGENPRNFHEVDPVNGIYRSAQPDHEEFAALEKRGFRSVLNLRNFHSDRGRLNGLKIREFAVPCNAGSMTEEHVYEALRIIRDEPKSLLIHCWHGSDRTGTVVAAYRIVFNGRVGEDADETHERGSVCGTVRARGGAACRLFAGPVPGDGERGVGSGCRSGPDAHPGSMAEEAASDCAAGFRPGCGRYAFRAVRRDREPPAGASGGNADRCRSGHDGERCHAGVLPPVRAGGGDGAETPGDSASGGLVLPRSTGEPVNGKGISLKYGEEPDSPGTFQTTAEIKILLGIHWG